MTHKIKDLSGLRAIVTGGASGIGAAVVAELTARGAVVSILDLNITSVPEGQLAFQCNVGERSSVNDAVNAAAQSMGGIDIVVNNAGVGAQGTVEANDDDEWSRVLNINITGIARVSCAAMPHLRQSPSASIVNTCSIAATAGLPERALYSASKGGVYSLTLAMAADHIREGIRVNAVNPGTVDTPWVGRLLDSAADPQAERQALNSRQPHGRLVSAQEVATSVAYLCSPLSSSTNGVALAVDGGMQALRLRPVG
ncbi:SDR family NAD(P)-dependent oxidoreductase [Glutamicibacter sp. Je.9.36]|uniref:SDR family NAD(P)-dependent oxidoreductase n=1 Tax=Glutamicibacter sp. Je.9.36 TaxID=3142837 RepID=UPI003DAA4B0F